MVRPSNALIVILNVISASTALFAIGISLYSHFHDGSSCQKFVRTPLLITGVAVFVVSIVGLIGSCGKMNSFLYLYLTVMFLCLVGLIGFTVLTFIVTNAGAGKAVSGLGFKEYRLGDYSNWLRNHLVNGGQWNKIRACLIESKVCSRLAKQGDLTLADFNKRSLSPVESGCCKPPVQCRFDFKNATYWTVPNLGPAAKDSDCKTWSNQQDTLCYNCDSCKAGFLGNIKQHWRSLLIFNACMIVFVIFVYGVGCCASKNNKNDHKYHSYRRGFE